MLDRVGSRCEHATVNLALRIASASLALSLLVMLGLHVVAMVGFARGWSWEPMDGSWMAALGFGAMWLAPVSTVALLVLIAAWVVRDMFRRNGGSS